MFHASRTLRVFASPGACQRGPFGKLCIAFSMGLPQIQRDICCTMALKCFQKNFQDII
jgi:hypothetical protein